ncbi:hypothetical protein Tco_0116682 [Tanacetum coccineum]
MSSVTPLQLFQKYAKVSDVGSKNYQVLSPPRTKVRKCGEKNLHPVEAESTVRIREIRRLMLLNTVQRSVRIVMKRHSHTLGTPFGSLGIGNKDFNTSTLNEFVDSRYHYDRVRIKPAILRYSDSSYPYDFHILDAEEEHVDIDKTVLLLTISQLARVASV